MKKAVLFDAMGTLVSLDPPGPLLQEALRAHRPDLAPPSGEEATAAMRTEIGHYRAHLQRGRDQAGLASLRRECAGVLRGALPERFHGIGDEEMTAILLAALCFRPYDDVVPLLSLLRSHGVRVAVVSNWDASLDDMLERTGLASYVEVGVASAVLGMAKPDVGPFLAALDALEVATSDALHVGDDVVADASGAAAAGIEAVLLDRHGAIDGDAAGTLTVVRSLSAVGGLLGMAG